MAVTLKDIAESMGLTATTVHRALYGKKGVSEETRRSVQQTAAAMGYRPNYLASSLKRKENLRFAVAMPDTAGDNRYYYGSLWKGVRSFLQEVEAYEVTPVEIAYPLEPGANGEALSRICGQESGRVCGVLTLADRSGQSAKYLEELAARRIPVAFVGADNPEAERLCCVRACDEMAGSLAAELLTSLGPCPRKVILTGQYGPQGMRDQAYNAGGFLDFMKMWAPSTQVIEIEGGDTVRIRGQIGAVLRREPEVSAIYSCSARHTVCVAQAVQDLGMEKRLRLIGNDCFEESLDYLRAGVLSAIIDKKIARQSYTAMKILFDCAVKAEYPSTQNVLIPPEIVLRSNAGMPGR